VAGRFHRDEFTDLVGRQDELAKIAALLGDSRLVTVVGPGGVGKTRVARAAAAQAMEGYLDGVWIVELSGLRDPELLPNTVANVFRLPEQDSRSALDSVLEYVRDRNLLLVLDTCEHLLDASAELVQAVLREAPGVTFLATSRQALDTPGEFCFQIQPLPVPEPKGGSDVLTLSCGSATELFEQRADAALRIDSPGSGFQLTAANVGDVIRICRRLDGIPLAVELAAVQLRTMPLGELAERLDHRFDVLNGGHPAALPRHQTLRTALEWSYGLCSASERRLWARLSVFAGTFRLDAAEDVCAEVSLERPEVVGALIGLVDKSVLQREGDRYRMLDTLREFGAEQLVLSGEQAACRWRHVGRYLSMARYFGAHFADDDQMDRYHELREAHPNLRAALEYALDTADGSTVEGVTAGSAGSTGSAETTVPAATLRRWRAGAEMACELYGYWQISGLLGEGGYWLSKVLERFPAPGPDRARALVNRGFLRSFQGDVGGALPDCEDGTAMALDFGEEAVAARGRQHTMLTLVFLGRHEEAYATGVEARSRLIACGDRTGELMLMAQTGHLYQLTGRLSETVAVCEEGLEMLGADSREQWIQTYFHVVSGFALFQMPGREAECETVVRKALLGKAELGDIIGMAYALDLLGWLAARTGMARRCGWLLGAAEPLWERAGVRFSGTEIMERFHQDAEAGARAAVGDAAYDIEHALGAGYMRKQLDDTAGGGAFKLALP
jgi:predicted ATPase